VKGTYRGTQQNKAKVLVITASNIGLFFPVFFADIFCSKCAIISDQLKITSNCQRVKSRQLWDEFCIYNRLVSTGIFHDTFMVGAWLSLVLTIYTVTYVAIAKVVIEIS